MIWKCAEDIQLLFHTKNLAHYLSKLTKLLWFLSFKNNSSTGSWESDKLTHMHTTYHIDHLLWPQCMKQRHLIFGCKFYKDVRTKKYIQYCIYNYLKFYSSTFFLPKVVALWLHHFSLQHSLTFTEEARRVKWKVFSFLHHEWF